MLASAHLQHYYTCAFPFVSRLGQAGAAFCTKSSELFDAQIAYCERASYIYP